MNLSEKVFELTDLDVLVEQLSLIFKKAIIIENANFELMAYSSPNEFSFDPVQQKTILTKRCPLFIIERLKKEGIVEKLKRKNRPIKIRLLEDIGVFQRVAASLKHENKVYGYIWIYVGSGELTENELTFLREISLHLGKLLFENENDSPKHDRQLVIWKLVNQDYLNDGEISHEANIVGYTIPEAFKVIVLSVKNLKYLSVLEQIKELFIVNEIAYYMGKGTEIIAIIDENMQSESVQRTDQIMIELEKQLTEEERSAFYIGIGNDYDQIDCIRKSYLEALEVIETMAFLNVEEQFTYYYHDLGMYRYIKLLYKKNKSDQYRNKIILQLLEKR